MRRKGKKIMVIDFLDDRFPREVKNKLFKLEEIIDNKTKNKSYNEYIESIILSERYLRNFVI